MTDVLDGNVGAPNPGNLTDCPDDTPSMRTGGAESILARLDNALDDDGGAYSAQQMPIKQAIQYSIIALNRGNHDALMQLVQVLAAQIIGRNQFCEATVSGLSKPFQRTIRGQIQRCDRGIRSLATHLANAACARTSYCRQMLNDCQCRMLGAEEPAEQTPEGATDSGIGAQSPLPAGSVGTETPPEASGNGSWTPNRPPVECQQWDICEGGYLWQWFQRFFQFHWPQIQHAIQRPPNVNVNAQGGNAAPALVEANADEWSKIMELSKNHDPEYVVRDMLGIEQGQFISPPTVGLAPSPVEEEHFPDELLPE